MGTEMKPELVSEWDKDRDRGGNQESESDQKQDGRGEVVGDNLLLKVESGRECTSGFRQEF